MRFPSGELQHVHAVDLPEGFDAFGQSWDMAFKDLVSSDYVVGQVWGKKRADSFLLDQRKDRLDFPGTLRAVRLLTESWPAA